MEQEELMLIFDHIQSLCQTERPLSSPNALFLAHCLRGVGNPSEAMFVATLRHLLQRPVLEDNDLPLFYQTLYAPSAEEAQEQRLWLLTWLRDGMCKPDVSLPQIHCHTGSQVRYRIGRLFAGGRLGNC